MHWEETQKAIDCTEASIDGIVVEELFPEAESSLQPAQADPVMPNCKSNQPWRELCISGTRGTFPGLGPGKGSLCGVWTPTRADRVRCCLEGVTKVNEGPFAAPRRPMQASSHAQCVLPLLTGGFGVSPKAKLVCPAGTQQVMKQAGSPERLFSVPSAELCSCLVTGKTGA